MVDLTEESLMPTTVRGNRVTPPSPTISTRLERNSTRDFRTTSPSDDHTAEGEDDIPMGSRAAFPDRTDQEFLNGILESVNQYRAKHGAPPVELDAELVEYA